MEHANESHPGVLAYTATDGEAEEDCKAPSSTATGAEQQSELSWKRSRTRCDLLQGANESLSVT